MNPRLLSQPLSPPLAKGSAARRLRTLGLAFFVGLFALLLSGDPAHAEEDLGVAPLEATAATSVDDTDTTPIDEAGPVDQASPAQEARSADPVAAPETASPAPTTLNDETHELAPLRVEFPVAAVFRGEDESIEASLEPFGSDVGAAPPVARELPRPGSARGVEAGLVTSQAHVDSAVHQCNADTYPTGAGWEATCVVTIENTLGSDGSTSSRVTTTWCLAEAGVLPPEGCTTDVTTGNSLVTSVDQCNGILAGGSNVTCSVEVVNNVPFGTPTTEVTVNQCIGSGQGGVSPGGPPTDCDPVDSSTSGATVTQCNGSANGGGAPERVRCTVTGGATALPVTVNQCNGSTAAGSTVTCDVTYTDNFAAVVTEPGGTPTPTPNPAPNSNPTPTDAPPPTATQAPFTTLTPSPVVPVSSRPVPADSGENARSTSAASSTASGRSITGSSSSTATSLAATGPATSTSGLLSAALLLLLLGGLLLTGSKRNACI